MRYAIPLYYQILWNVKCWTQLVPKMITMEMKYLSTNILGELKTMQLSNLDTCIIMGKMEVSCLFFIPPCYFIGWKVEFKWLACVSAVLTMVHVLSWEEFSIWCAMPSFRKWCTILDAELKPQRSLESSS